MEPRESNLCPRGDRFWIQGAEAVDSNLCPVDESLFVQSVEPGESTHVSAVHEIISCVFSPWNLGFEPVPCR